MKPVQGKARSWVNIIVVTAFLILAATWTVWRFQYTNQPKLPVTNLQTSAYTSPAGQNVLPEQRRKFALEFGKKFKTKGMDVTVTTTGDFHTSILIQGKLVNEPLVVEMAKSAQGMQDLREMGFKHLIMTDGKTSWDVDLKN